MGAGQNALAARCSITTESLPPENSITGDAKVAATSRMMWIDSDSRASSSLSGLSPPAVIGGSRGSSPLPRSNGPSSDRYFGYRRQQCLRPLDTELDVDPTRVDRQLRGQRALVR